MSSGLLLLIAAFLVVLNGFFVAAEFALVKVRSTRVDELVREGRAAARIVRRQLTHLNEYLAACQFGITIASLGLGWAGEGAVEKLVHPILDRLGLTLSPTGLALLGGAIAFSTITCLHIVAGEQVPKIMGIERAENTALACAYPLQLFHRIFKGPVVLLNAATGVVARLFGFKATGEHEQAHSEQELRSILTHSHRRGVIRESELDLVEHVFVFADKRAREVMVPRVDMVYLDTEWSFQRNFAHATAHSFTRFPLCEGDPDHVLGLIHIRDLLRLRDQPDPDLSSIRRDIVVVPESKQIDDLLREFQRRKIHMAVVLDEYGGTAGIVTLENVLEEIVGEIHDEFEEADPEVKELGDHCYLVDGKVTLTDLRNDFRMEIPQNGADTVGGWIMDKAGGIPHPGQVIEQGPFRFEVVEMDGQRVRRVLIQAPPPLPEVESAAEH